MSLIAHWPLMGNLNEYTGNGYTLTNSGTNTSLTAGKIGKAYNKTDGYYLTNLSTIPEAVTIAAWFKHNGSNWLSECLFGTRGGSDGFMIYRNDGDTDNYYRIYVWYVNTSSATVGYYSWQGLTGITADEWHHIAMSRYADGRMIIYIDGVSAMDKAAPGDFSSWSNNDRDLAFHAQGDGGSYTAGDYDFNDFRIYDHALSAKEVYDLSKAKILHYDFNQFAEPTKNLMLDSFDTSMQTLTGWKSTGVVNGDGSITFPAINNWYYISSSSSGNLIGSFAAADVVTFSGKVKVSTIATSATALRLSIRFVNNVGASISYDALVIPLTSVSDGNYYYFKNEDITIPATYYSMAILMYFDGATVADGEVILKELQIEKKSYTTPFTYDERTAQISDSSGYAYHANLKDYTDTYFPEYIHSAEGIGSGSYDFGIDSAAPKRIQCSTFDNPSDQITINMWIHPIDIGSFSRGFAMKSDNRDGANGWAWRTGWGNDVRFNIGGNTEVAYTSTVDGVLSMLTGTYNSVTGVQKWYKNGVLQQTRNLTPAVIGNSTASLYVGFVYSSDYMKGTIEDFRIYATEFSQTDIDMLYESRTKLDNVGNFYTTELDINGVGLQTNSIPYEQMTEEVLTVTTNWYDNYGTSSYINNRIYYSKQTNYNMEIEVADNPVGQLDLMSKIEIDTTEFVQNKHNDINYYFVTDPTKTHRVSQWVYLGYVAGTSGYQRNYFGVGGNHVCNINTTTLNSNPYFTYPRMDDANTSQKWALWVYHIYPYNSTGNPLYGGMYLADGTFYATGNNFNWATGITNTYLRQYTMYQYAEIAAGNYVKRYRPRIDIVDGTEPSIEELLSCLEHRPLVDENGDYIKTKSITEKGVSFFLDIDEVSGTSNGQAAEITIDGVLVIEGEFKEVE